MLGKVGGELGEAEGDGLFTGFEVVGRVTGCFEGCGKMAEIVG